MSPYLSNAPLLMDVLCISGDEIVQFLWDHHTVEHETERSDSRQQTRGFRCSCAQQNEGALRLHKVNSAGSVVFSETNDSLLHPHMS